MKQWREWIPSEKRHPKDEQWVLTCDRDEFITTMRYCADDPPCFVDDHEEYFPYTDIAAWMPLPKPYEGVYDGTNS